MITTALYVVIHDDDTDPTVKQLTVGELWRDPRLADTDVGTMLSAIHALHRRSVARDTLAPMMLVLGSVDAFRQQLASWYRTTALSLADREEVQAILGWQHPLGDAVNDAPLRALWTYLIEAGGECVVDQLSPDDFYHWVAYGGYPRGITPLEPRDPTPETTGAMVVSDLLTGREFVLSA